MSLFSLIVRSLKYYFRGHLTVALGIAITTAIITGALIVGDSVKYSLEQITYYRLGSITHVVNSGERYLTQSLSNKIAQQTGIKATSALRIKGTGIVGGGKYRIENIQVWGIDSSFRKTIDTAFPYDSIPQGEVVISQNLANRLMLEPGESFLLSMKRAHVIPLNTPFISADNQNVARRFKVFKIADKHIFGRFNLKASQTAPFNVFLPIGELNNLIELRNKANRILIAGSLSDQSSLLKKSIRKNFTINDASLHLHYLKSNKEWEVTSERVFIDKSLAKVMMDLVDSFQPVLTYFVNKIQYNGRFTPYSFVSTLDDPDLTYNEIVLNSWTAKDIQAEIGDSVTLYYYLSGPLRQLEIQRARFKVKKVVPIQGRYGDKNLMPDFPGLSDVNNCRDWNAGIPIDLNRIRDKDETYWDQYRGTPKAFISLERAVDLWENRYGSYTALRFQHHSASYHEIKGRLNQAVNPFNLGIVLQPVKKQGLRAARQGVDFSQLFMGLSFFILVSGIFLTALLFVFNLEKRYSQIGTLSALGYPNARIVKIILAENALVAFLGTLVGIGLALVYNKLVFLGLNRVWQEIVRTNVLEMNIQPITLLTGFGISILVSWLTIAIVLNRKLKQRTSGIQKHAHRPPKSWIPQLLRNLIIILPVIVLGIVGMQVLSGAFNEPVWFFIAGGLLLVFIVLLSFYLFLRYERMYSASFTLHTLALKNLVRNRTRSLTVILLLSLGSFVVISTGANRKNIFGGAQNKDSGTGGYLFYAESTVPVLEDLENDSVRRSFGLDTNFHVVQFKMFEGEDASCLNLNRVSNPGILGVDPGDLSGRFSFVTQTPYLDRDHPSRSLNRQIPGVIPAFADQTVIKWGLGKSIGDTLRYRSQSGDTIHVKLIGGLAASVFQGHIIISNRYFIRHFPEISGSNVFLVNGVKENQEAIKKQLKLVFRDHGWQMNLAAKRLAEFMSVTNTYLSIFLVLGALGLLLGTVGLAVVLARSILQRNHEIALLLATGYSFGQVFKLLFKEYFLLMILGITGGGISAIIAVMPSFFVEQQNISVTFILLLLGVVMLNGIIWIGIIAYFRLKNIRVIESLKNY